MDSQTGTLMGRLMVPPLSHGATARPQLPALILDAETLQPRRAIEYSVGAVCGLTVYLSLVWERVYVHAEYDERLFWGE